MRGRTLGGALLLGLLGPLGCGGTSSGPSARDVAVAVRLVTLDPVSNTPVIILEEKEGSRRLPIWVGVAEAHSIAQRLEEVELPRPNTHDLAKRLVEGLNGAVERVTVTDLREGTYYAVIALRRDGKLVEIDSRPSDAIALALRMAAPVFVREPLFDTTPQLEAPDEPPGQPARAPGGAGIRSASPGVAPGIPTRIGGPLAPRPRSFA